jgi:hypothetical protein
MSNYFLYLDPGSGSYLLQMIIAAVVGASFFFKNFWLGVKSFFGFKKKDNDKIEK